MSDRTRLIVALAFIVIGATLVITGHMSGEQWANTIGGIFTGAGGGALFPQAK